MILDIAKTKDHRKLFKSLYTPDKTRVTIFKSKENEHFNYDNDFTIIFIAQFVAVNFHL